VWDMNFIICFQLQRLVFSFSIFITRARAILNDPISLRFFQQQQ
jgi:hypothetical protein